MDLIAQNVFFFLIAAGMVVGALRVVTTKNIVHAALWLVLVLAGAAAQYILLLAEFTAAVQVMVYIGAVVVLFLFGIMLTRAPLGDSLEVDKNQMVMGLAVAIPLLALLGFSLWDTWGDTEFDVEAAAGNQPAQIDIPTDAADVEDSTEEEDSGGAADAALEVGATFTEGGGSFAVSGSNTKTVSDSIFRDYLIAFEAISVLLLAALIGAICLARRD
jgi:NADH-quinone oxidoreductase subunit J